MVNKSFPLQAKSLSRNPRQMQSLFPTKELILPKVQQIGHFITCSDMYVISHNTVHFCKKLQFFKLPFLLLCNWKSSLSWAISITTSWHDYQLNSFAPNSYQFKKNLPDSDHSFKDRFEHNFQCGFCSNLSSMPKSGNLVEAAL